MERKVGDLTVRIERDSCIASGNCVKVAPDLFELDDENLAAFRSPEKDPGRDCVIDACRVCPVEALLVSDADGSDLVP